MEGGGGRVTSGTGNEDTGIGRQLTWNTDTHHYIAERE